MNNQSRAVKPNDLLRNPGPKTQFTKQRVLQGREGNWAENARLLNPRRACSPELAVSERASPGPLRGGRGRISQEEEAVSMPRTPLFAGTPAALCPLRPLALPARQVAEAEVARASPYPRSLLVGVRSAHFTAGFLSGQSAADHSKLTPPCTSAVGMCAFPLRMCLSVCFPENVRLNSLNIY